MIEIIQGQKQKEAEALPTRLDVLREYDKRHALNEKYKETLDRLESGHQGERIVLDCINKYGAPHWKVVKNIWLENYGIFECDLLLITRNDWYPIEIKHYSGQYELKNSQWNCYGTKLPNNPISQSQKVFIHFLNLTREEKLPVNVKGRIIFTGDHFDLEIGDQVGDLEIVTLNQLRDHIRDIAWNERNSNAREIDINRVTDFINQYETTNPFPPIDLYRELGHQMKKGVRCSHCGSFDLNLKLSYISCSCGMHEPKEMAIVRTICEFGVIHFNKDLQISEVVDFFDGSFSEPTLRKYLNKYFKRYGGGRGTKYDNYRKFLDQILHLFNFKRSRYFKYH